jgi:predicted O-linked N-acetylglucosamine transferase (SPINDLY family)
LSARASEAGVNAARIIFSPRVNHSEFCGRLKLANLFLDTYPYNCGSTSNDVINSNLYMVSMIGQTLVSRMGLSFAKNHHGMISIAESFPDYENKVVAFYDLIIKPKSVTKKLPNFGSFAYAAMSGYAKNHDIFK